MAPRNLEPLSISHQLGGASTPTTLLNIRQLLRPVLLGALRADLVSARAARRPRKLGHLQYLVHHRVVTTPLEHLLVQRREPGLRLLLPQSLLPQEEHSLRASSAYLGRGAGLRRPLCLQVPLPDQPLRGGSCRPFLTRSTLPERRPAL